MDAPNALPTRTIRLPSGSPLHPFHYYDLRPASDTMFAGAFARREDRTRLLCSPSSLLRVGGTLRQFEGQTCWYDGKGTVTLVYPGHNEAGWRKVTFPHTAQQESEASRWAEVLKYRTLAIKLATSASLQSFQIYHYHVRQDRFVSSSTDDHLCYVTATGDTVPLTYRMAFDLNVPLVFNATHNIVQRRLPGRTDAGIYIFDWPTVGMLRIWALEHPASPRKPTSQVPIPQPRPASVAQRQPVSVQTKPKSAQVAFAIRPSSTLSGSSQSVLKRKSKNMQFIQQGQILYIPWIYNGYQFEDAFAVRSGAFYLIHSTGFCQTPLSYRDLPGIRTDQDKPLDPQAVVRCAHYNWIYQKDESKLTIPGRLVLAHKDAPFTVKFPYDLIQSLPPISTYASSSSLRPPSRSSIVERTGKPSQSQPTLSSAQKQTSTLSHLPSSSHSPYRSQNQKNRDSQSQKERSRYASRPSPLSRSFGYRSLFSKTAMLAKLSQARNNWRWPRR